MKPFIDPVLEFPLRAAALWCAPTCRALAASKQKIEKSRKKTTFRGYERGSALINVPIGYRKSTPVVSCSALWTFTVLPSYPLTRPVTFSSFLSKYNLIRLPNPFPRRLWRGGPCSSHRSIQFWPGLPIFDGSTVGLGGFNHLDPNHLEPCPLTSGPIWWTGGDWLASIR